MILIRPAARPWCFATMMGSLALIPACDQPTGSSRPTSSAPAPVISADSVPDAPAPPAPITPAKPKFIVGERTTEIRDASVETKKGGVVNEPKITAKDPILMAGNAYVTIVGKSAILNIKHAVDLYEAETGQYPKTYDEFKEKIITANNIALPLLPFYQEYGYDAPSHSLIILEYPDRKTQANYPR